MIQIIVRTHQDAIFYLCPGGNNTAHADNRMCDLRLLNLATFGQQHIPKIAILHDGTGQEARVSIDGALAIKEVERWVLSGQFQIGFVEGTDGPDIPPIAVEVETVDSAVVDGVGNDVTAKIIETWIIAQEIDQNLCIEEINSH